MYDPGGCWRLLQVAGVPLEHLSLYMLPNGKRMKEEDDVFLEHLIYFQLLVKLWFFVSFGKSKIYSFHLKPPFLFHPPLGYLHHLHSISSLPLTWYLEASLLVRTTSLQHSVIDFVFFFLRKKYITAWDVSDKPELYTLSSLSLISLVNHFQALNTLDPSDADTFLRADMLFKRS